MKHAPPPREMLLLMSRLGRPDVLPVGDFAVRKGFQLTYDLEEMPKPKALNDGKVAIRPVVWQKVFIYPIC